MGYHVSVMLCVMILKVEIKDKNIRKFQIRQKIHFQFSVLCPYELISISVIPGPFFWDSKNECWLLSLTLNWTLDWSWSWRISVLMQIMNSYDIVFCTKHGKKKRSENIILLRKNIRCRKSKFFRDAFVFLQ